MLYWTGRHEIPAIILEESVFEIVYKFNVLYRKLSPREIPLTQRERCLHQ
jgi:hypothetical protein